MRSFLSTTPCPPSIYDSFTFLINGGRVLRLELRAAWMQDLSYFHLDIFKYLTEKFCDWNFKSRKIITTKSKHTHTHVHTLSYINTHSHINPSIHILHFMLSDTENYFKFWLRFALLWKAECFSTFWEGTISLKMLRMLRIYFFPVSK